LIVPRGDDNLSQKGDPLDQLAQVIHFGKPFDQWPNAFLASSGPKGVGLPSMPMCIFSVLAFQTLHDLSDDHMACHDLRSTLMYAFPWP
jgi:hypothetical protein